MLQRMRMRILPSLINPRTICRWCLSFTARFRDAKSRASSRQSHHTSLLNMLQHTKPVPPDLMEKLLRVHETSSERTFALLSVYYFRKLKTFISDWDNCRWKTTPIPTEWLMAAIKRKWKANCWLLMFGVVLAVVFLRMGRFLGVFFGDCWISCRDTFPKMNS